MKRQTVLQWARITLVLIVAALGTPAIAGAGAIGITINTAAFTGTSGFLAFDFIDGGAPANTFVVSGFSTNGVLGSSSSTGGSTGALPGTVTLSDASFFNEYLTGITLGSSLSFLLTATNQAPQPGSSPDSFSVFLLNAAGLPLVNTADPTGSGALLTLDLTGRGLGNLNTYGTTGPGGQILVTAAEVPEPASLLLLATGLGGLCVWHLRVRRPRGR